MRFLAATFMLVIASTQINAQTMGEHLQNAGGDKTILCAPLLVKYGMLLDVAASKQVLDGNPNAAKTKNAAFQILYRGHALDALAKASNPTALEAAWQIPIDKDRSEVSRLVGLCVDFYNAQRKSGMIPEQAEKDAAAKTNAALKAK